MRQKYVFLCTGNAFGVSGVVTHVRWLLEKGTHFGRSLGLMMMLLLNTAVPCITVCVYVLFDGD